MIEAIAQFIITFIGIFLIFGLPILGIFWAIRAHDRTVKKRDEMLKSAFGQDIKVYRSFPIPMNIEEVAQGGLHQIIQRFRELIVTDTWLFIQPTFLSVPRITLTEDRNSSMLSLFSRKLEAYSPTFVIRNRQNKSLISRFYQVQINNNELVKSELNFDTEQNLYAEKGKHIQALQIMSPELLEVLKNAPAGADIIIRKNQLYYLLAGEKPAELVLNDILVHSAVVAKELTNNLDRWGQSQANQEELEAIKHMDLADTLTEQYQASLKQ